jgi:hypothetical protein
MQIQALHLALKALDPETFQKLCFHLLKQKHPELDLKHVDGRGGDEGLDVFAGELYGEPAIWQCKAFPNGLGQSQRAKVKESLRTALKNFSLSFWVLCLSVDMDTKARRWFEKLQKSYESKVRLTELSASEIVNELLFRRTLRNSFFPTVMLDIPELRRRVTETGKLSTQELGKLTDENVEDLIERHQDQDARFRYEYVFDPESGPPSAQVPTSPGLFMTIADGAKKLNLYAKDVKALQANPPRFSLGFTSSGAKKFESFLDTGAPQEFEVDDLGPFTSNLPLLKDSPVTPQKLTVAPSPAVTNRKRNVRVIFRRSEAECLQYNLMEMNPVQVGRKEMTLAVSHARVPLRIQFVTPIPLTQGANVSITIEFQDKRHDVRELKKALDALAIMRPSGKLLVIDIETEQTFLDVTVEMPPEKSRVARYRNLLGILVRIADRFDVTLRTSSKPTKKDLETIALLKRYMDNDTLDLSEITMTVVKSEKNENLFSEQLPNGKGLFRVANQEYTPVPEVFGIPVRTGPVAMDMEAEIRNFPETLENFQKAHMGSGVKISLRPLGPVRFSLLPQLDV